MYYICFIVIIIKTNIRIKTLYSTHGGKERKRKAYFIFNVNVSSGFHCVLEVSGIICTAGLVNQFVGSMLGCSEI